MESYLFVGFSPSMSNGKRNSESVTLYSKLHDDRLTEKNQFTVHELAYILFKRIEYKRNYVCFAYPLLHGNSVDLFPAM